MWRRRKSVELLETRNVEAFFDRLDHLNQEQLLSMRAAWQAVGRQAHEESWTAVRVVGAREGLTREIDRVRDKAIAWATRGSDSVPYNRPNDTESWLQVKMEASEAIVDAALALALGDRLDAAIHDLLIGPWLRATGQLD